MGTAYLADPALREQYAREIAPRTEAALARVLDLAWRAPPPARALDLGSGTGAVGRTLRVRFGAGLEVVGVDRTAAPGVLAADLAVEMPRVAGRFDLIVAAHLLNELFNGRPAAERIARRAARVAAWAGAFLSPGGRLILIEPALRETSRELLAVRDQLVAGGLAVVAPCFRQGPCPALAAESDWCHDAAATSTRGRIDFSYLVVAHEAVAPAPGLVRVVSDPLPDKGRLRLFVCGDDGRYELIRLNRHRAAENGALDRAARGSALAIAGAERAGQSLRVTPATTIAATDR